MAIFFEGDSEPKGDLGGSVAALHVVTVTEEGSPWPGLPDRRLAEH